MSQAISCLSTLRDCPLWQRLFYQGCLERLCGSGFTCVPVLKLSKILPLPSLPEETLEFGVENLTLQYWYPLKYWCLVDMDWCLRTGKTSPSRVAGLPLLPDRPVPQQLSSVTNELTEVTENGNQTTLSWVFGSCSPMLQPHKAKDPCSNIRPQFHKFH